MSQTCSALRQPNSQAESISETAAIAWPQKHDVLGVQVSATSYDEVVNCLIQAARHNVPAVATFTAVHAVVTMSGDDKLRALANSFEIVAPDGQPVRWALNMLHRAGLKERVYGPELMLRLCEEAAREAVPIFLYGGTDERLNSLCDNLIDRFPALQIAGRYAPPFRPLTEAEDQEVVRSIRSSGARIVFVGLGAPKQDIFAATHRERLDTVWVCVGAAFDLHAGIKTMAPRWMQRAGLEWLFRLVQEPRRLARRYFETNTIFVGKLALACMSRVVAGRRRDPASCPERIGAQKVTAS